MLLPVLFAPLVCRAETNLEFIQSKLQGDWACQSVKNDDIILCHQGSNSNNVFYFAKRNYSQSVMKPASSEKSLRNYNEVLLFEKRCKNGYKIVYKNENIKPGVSSTSAEYICKETYSKSEYGIEKFIIGTSATFIGHLGYEVSRVEQKNLHNPISEFESLKKVIYYMDELSN